MTRPWSLRGRGIRTGRRSLTLASLLWAAAIARPLDARSEPARPLHATLVRSEPADAERLGASPSRIWLLFSEEIEAPLSRFTLVGPDGRSTALAAAADPRNVRAVEAPLPPLAIGGYRLQWRIVSADGHPVEGTLAFIVGGGAAPDTTGVTPPPPAPAPAESHPSAPGEIAGAPIAAGLLRGAGMMCLLALTGFLSFWTRRGSPPPSGAGRASALRLATALAAAALALLGAHLALWIATVSPDRALDGPSIAAVASTRVGRAEMLRVGLVVMALWAIGLAQRGRLALLFALGAVVASSAIGHAAAIQPAWSITTKAVHLLAASLWLGGLVWLTTRDRGDAGAFRHEARYVSAMALASVIAVALTGVAQTIVMLSHVSDLVHAPYGRLVLAKVAGLGVLIAFGAYHRYVVMPGLDRTPIPAPQDALARSVRREIAVMAVVILVAGILAYVAPPADAVASTDASVNPTLR